MREGLSDNASGILKKLAENECEIFDKGVKLHNEKEKERIEALKKKLEQEMADVNKSRRLQLQRKVQDAEFEKKLEDLYVEELARKVTAQQELEHQKQLERRRQNIELRKMHQDQIRENERNVAKEKADALMEEHHKFHELKKEEVIFNDFVKKEMEYLKSQGKKTNLLQKTLHS